ncbi:MAG: alanine--tRNA ligase [Myxococcota bacterium]|nr:alanine--tRNA ligase [Myxococcota bacterium]
MTSSRQLRRSFLDFFASHDHRVVPSGPLVLSHDPTLMFANAGMVQFKDVFTGRERREYRRAASAQKCLRISGKHNDLENVGRTPRHHTFFEMLGNFSFGDYFKREAIAYAWQYVTEVLRLEPERMVVTVFGGQDGMPPDTEAAALWRELAGMPPERIVPCGAADNFWAMGDVGPCGPCTEIHYCLGEGPVDPRGFGQEQSPDGRGWFELWNLVFMQFERRPDGSLEPLPAPCVDTGAGLERFAVVTQGVLSNYDTDLLRPLVDRAAELSGRRYGGSSSEDDVSMRVIADHARATAFVVAEGVFPDREGRSYVLRRIVRRAVRHGHRLGIREPFLHEVVGLVVDRMGDDYPELRERRALLLDVTRQEEERFRHTLERGLALLDENAEWEIAADGRRVLPGRVAFTLYDTYGFPLDLQQVIGQERGFGVDEAGFEAELERARARSAGSKVGGAAVDAVWHAIASDTGEVEHVAHDAERAEGTLLAIVVDGARVERLEAGQAAALVASRTPFYAEAGGQVGDRGQIALPDGSARFVVEDTQAPRDGLVVHVGRLERGRLCVGDPVVLEVDHALRSATRRNHSATHLLHWALREVVGPTAMQKGSLVAPDRLRFDYAASQPLTEAQIERIEDLVNDVVLRNEPIVTEVLPLEQARARGAIGIFEEKYGAVVRLLRIGPSLELCGGTHASATGDIGIFKILSDSALAAGVRRIEAATGHNALRWVRGLQQEVSAAARALRVGPRELVGRAERLVEELRERERQLETMRRRLVAASATDLEQRVRSVDGLRVLGAVVEAGEPHALREMVDRLRERLAPAVVLLGTRTADGRALLACGVSKGATSRIAAGDLVRRAAAHVGGGGGGRPDFAQAGGQDPSGLDRAVAVAYEMLGLDPPGL